MANKKIISFHIIITYFLDGSNKYPETALSPDPNDFNLKRSVPFLDVGHWACRLVSTQISFLPEDSFVALNTHSPNALTCLSFEVQLKKLLLY
jgi:hypothetical protein